MEGARCVLVVDDDQGVRETFAYVLTLAGYTVQIAATAEEALRCVGQDRPDAILVDLKMPLINGAGFLFRLRKNPANRDIAVAVITAAPVLDEETIDDLRTLRAQIWHKPLSIEDIQQIARALVADAPASAASTVDHRPAPAAPAIHVAGPSLDRCVTRDARGQNTRGLPPRRE